MGFPGLGMRGRGTERSIPETRAGGRQDGGGLLGGPGKGRQQPSKHAKSGSRKDKDKDSGGEGGLLIIQKGRKHFFYSLFMEFLGLMLFSLFGNSVTPEFAPAGNGLVLAVLIYITANVSGGHLNPAVTFAAMITGHISILKGVLYWIAQISGGIVGTLLGVGLQPGLSVGTTAIACFVPGTGVSKAQAFGWELFSTFLLVATVYAVAIGKPSFGNVGPLAIGLSLWGAANCAGGFTGAALNPARALGPFAVFHCYGGKIWVYVLGEMLGGALAGLLSWPLYGTGPYWGKTVDPELTEEETDDQDDHNGEGNQDRMGGRNQHQQMAHNV